MKTFILLLAFYSGVFGKSDNVSLTHAEFSSKATCEAAGQAAVQQFQTFIKTAKYVCVEK